MTRLAASNYGIWRGILETNRDAIKHEIDRFYRSLSFLSNGMLGNEVALAWESAGKLRRAMGPDSLARPRKHDLRSMIDRYDKQILGSLSHRIEIAHKIGKLKMHQSTPVSDPDRERRMMRQREEWGKALGLPGDLVEELFAVIVKHSRRIQGSET
jgi:chorismate mutase